MLHELTHLKHFNHSRHFWEEMDRLLGDAKALDARLSTYQALLLQ
jgi:predicted metal-dependent hydrolase